MIFSTRNFDPLTPLAPKFPNFAMQLLLFRSKHTVAVVTHAHVLQNFYTTWVRGVACQKQRLGPKLEPATTNLVHKLGLGLAYQKQRFGPKLAWVWAKGAFKKIRDPLRISATAEASNFKFCTQIWFETSLPKKTAFRTKFGGVLARGASRKIGTSYLFLQPLKLATSNLYTTCVWD